MPRLPGASRKSWARLAYLVLNERPPTRHRLAALLYQEAEDPLRALRWGLSEVRRVRGLATIEGDPVVLSRHPDLMIDVEVVAGGRGRARCECRPSVVSSSRA